MTSPDVEDGCGALITVLVPVWWQAIYFNLCPVIRKIEHKYLWVSIQIWLKGYSSLEPGIRRITGSHGKSLVHLFSRTRSFGRYDSLSVELGLRDTTLPNEL